MSGPDGSNRHELSSVQLCFESKFLKSPFQSPLINILEEQFHSASENEGDKYGDENQDPNTTLDKGPIAKQECSFLLYFRWVTSSH